MFRLKYAMLFMSAFAFMLGNSNAMQKGDDSKKPRLPKFEREFYINTSQDDSETIEEDFERVNNTQSSNSQSSNVEDSETEEMEIEPIANHREILDENFQFTVHPKLQNRYNHSYDYKQMKIELFELSSMISEGGISSESQANDWKEIYELFMSDAFNIGNFFKTDEERRIITKTYKANMTALYRYMYNHGLLPMFPYITEFFNRWIKRQNKYSM